MLLFTSLPLLLLLGLVCQQVSADNNGEGKDLKPNELPPIWTAIRPDKSYKVTYHLYMLDSAERVTVEEWASFDDQLFRLDLITAEARTSYLSNGETNEIFRYKPFECVQLDPKSSDLGVIGGLFLGLSLDSGSADTKGDDKSTIKAYGLGPLWLRAASDAKVNLITNDPTISKRRQKFQGYFNSYDVHFNSSANQDLSSSKFDLRFYFSKSNQHFVTAVEWLPLKDPTDASTSVRRRAEARAKLILVDLSPIDSSIFELPVGYGCQRKSEPETSAIDLSLDVLPQGALTQASFDISLSRPIDQKLRTWQSERFTVRVVRGSLLNDGIERAYYATETQARDPDTWGQRRIRRVMASEPNVEESIVYTIDTSKNTCLVRHMDHGQLVKLAFPTKDTSLTDETITPLSISLDLITYLLADKSGYHLLEQRISNHETLGNDHTRESTYEKRVKNLESSKGNVFWNGTTSIIKRVHSFVMYTGQDNESDTLISQYHTSITLLLYSADGSELQYKAVFELLDNQHVSLGYLHKQLDVGACFELDKKADVVIKYPLESAELAKKLEDAKELVHELTLMSILAAVPIRPLQVSGLQLDFDSFFMHVKLTLLDIPLTQTFQMRRSLRLAKGIPHAIIYKMASSAEKCAIACDYNHCVSFSYEILTLRCHLGLEGFADKLKSQPCDMCMLYESRNLKGRRHLRPLELLDLLTNSVAYVDSSDETNKIGGPTIDTGEGGIDVNPLNPIDGRDKSPLTLKIPSIVLWGDQLELKGEPEVVELSPISVHSDLDSMNEFLHKDGEDENSSGVIALDASNLHVDYSIGFEASELSLSVSEEQKGEFTYEECAKICEDTDCRSFSYSRATQKCRISRLHRQEDINPNLEACPTGTVFVLDYLSKFEAFGLLRPPLNAYKVIQGISENDCASACMEEKGFDCQGFYSCKEKMSDKPEFLTCRLQNQHMDSEISLVQPRTKLAATQDKFEQVLSPVDASTTTCNFFSRSYLAQFDEYHGRALNIKQEEDLSGRSYSNLGSESCARLCLLESCVAFDLCHSQGSDGKLQRQCRLANQTLRRTNLVSKHKCTTFVLSDKSQFRLKNTALFVENPDLPDRVALDKEDGSSSIIDVSDKQEDEMLGLPEVDSLPGAAARRSSGTHWFRSLFIGSFVGICGALVWREKDAIYNLATRIR